MMSQLLQNLLVKGKTAYLSLSHAHNRELLLYLLLLLFLPTQLGKHFWPDYSLVSGFRVDYLSPTLYFTDCLLALLVVHWLLFTPKQSYRILRSTLLPYILIGVFLLLTLVTAVSPLVGIVGILRLASLAFLAYFTATHLYAVRYSFCVYLALSIGILFESLLAFAQVIAKGYLGGPLYYLGERAISSLTPGAATAVLNGEIFLRAYGTFSHPNVLAGFLVLSMSYLLLTRRNITFLYQPFLLSIIFGVGTAGLMLTLSRVAILLWATLLIGVGITSLLTGRQKQATPLPHRTLVVRGGLVLGFFILLLIIALPLLGPVMTRFTQSSFTEESFIVRKDLAHTAERVIKENPALGVGLGNFIYASSALKQPDDPLYFATQPVHNIFLLVAAETGLLGLFIFSWILLLAFAKGNTPSRILLLMVLILGMVDHYLLTIQQGQLLFSFIIGCCFSTKDKSK